MTDKDQTLLYVGIVEDFKNETTLLLLGSSEGFEKLATKIELRESGDLSEINWVRQVCVNVHLSYCERCAVDLSAEDVYWRICNAAARLFPEQLRGLALSQRPGHAYLECPSGEPTMQVVASRDEYDPQRVFGG